MGEDRIETSKETQEGINKARERLDLVKRIHDNKAEQNHREWQEREKAAWEKNFPDEPYPGPYEE